MAAGLVAGKARTRLIVVDESVRVGFVAYFCVAVAYAYFPQCVVRVSVGLVSQFIITAVQRQIDVFGSIIERLVSIGCSEDKLVRLAVLVDFCSYLIV